MSAINPCRCGKVGTLIGASGYSWVECLNHDCVIGFVRTKDRDSAIEATGDWNSFFPIPPPPETPKTCPKPGWKDILKEPPACT